jgi:hypothetical protein
LSTLNEAVVFFRDGDVVKDMFYSEFEAVLDDVVGIPDFSGEEVNTAFIQIDESLKITGAVFFDVSFDSNGRVTGNWNIPLRYLFDHANFGLDLGATPIKVASRCEVPNGMYHEWLTHYHLPICRKRDDSGQYCFDQVKLITAKNTVNPSLKFNDLACRD